MVIQRVVKTRNFELGEREGGASTKNRRQVLVTRSCCALRDFFFSVIRLFKICFPLIGWAVHLEFKVLLNYDLLPNESSKAHVKIELRTRRAGSTFRLTKFILRVKHTMRIARRRDQSDLYFSCSSLSSQWRVLVISMPLRFMTATMAPRSHGRNHSETKTKPGRNHSYFIAETMKPSFYRKKNIHMYIFIF